MYPLFADTRFKHALVVFYTDPAHYSARFSSSVPYIPGGTYFLDIMYQAVHQPLAIGHWALGIGH